jgi:hypothetical protein
MNKCLRGDKWYIDDQGGLFAEEYGCLRRSLGITDVGPSSLTYAVQNMGFVGIADHGPRVDVRLRPRMLTNKSVGAICYWLMERRCVPVRMCWYNEDHWVLAYCVSAKATIDLLTLLLSRVGMTIPEECVVLAPSSEARRKWIGFEGLFMRTLMNGDITEQSLRVLEQSFGKRWSLVDVDESNERIFVTHQGRATPPLDPSFSTGRGFDLRQMTDERYRKSLQHTIMSVVHNGQPRFDDFDVIVEHPGMGLVRAQGWRALVPIRVSSLGSRLVSISGQDSTVDLRCRVV